MLRPPCFVSAPPGAHIGINHEERRRMKAGRWMTAPAAALLLAACGGRGSGDEIRVGLAGSMGTSGGRAVRQAAELAVAEINARGGIDGRKLALVIKDDGGDAEKAISVAGELRDDPSVVAVVGHINSAATLAAATVYNDPRGGVAEISPTASSPAVTQAGPWTFRVSPSDLAYGPALARWSRAQGQRRAAVLYVNDDYGRGVAASFADAFRRGGGQVVEADPYLPDVLDEGTGIEPYLRRAMGRGIDALFIAGTAADAEKILPAVRRLGFAGWVMGADGLLGIESSGAVGEGVFIAAAFFADAPGDAPRRFVEAYARAYHQPPNADAALAYDAVNVIGRALAGAGTDRKRIRDYLDGIGTRTPAIEGVTGSIRFDRNGDIARTDVAVGMVRGGTVMSAVR